MKTWITNIKHISGASKKSLFHNVKQQLVIHCKSKSNGDHSAHWAAVLKYRRDLADKKERKKEGMHPEYIAGYNLTLQAYKEEYERLLQLAAREEGDRAKHFCDLCKAAVSPAHSKSIISEQSWSELPSYRVQV